jgi:phosphoribosyl-AMP cyclohydrolase
MDIDKINFDKLGGIIPVVVQDYRTKEVLMLGFMNREALIETLKRGKAVYYSRSRKRLWLKGEVSGHYQIVKEIRIDCDEDSLVLLVEQIGGAACHLGYRSCFFRGIDKNGNFYSLGVEKVFSPEEVYKR